jgi:multidrug efflux pump subunit AcrA (membrane-fusion protein)
MKTFSILVLCLLTVACGRREAAPAGDGDATGMQVVQPQRRTITRVVKQPSYVVAYERSSVYPKMTAYIEKWVVDIGDKVKEGDKLATLFVPEVREEWESRKRTVKLDKSRVEMALKQVKVAEANVKAAQAHIQEAKKMVANYEARVKRWQSEVDRLTAEVEKRVVAPQILLESQKQLQADVAQVDAAKATVAKTEAELLSREAEVEQELVNVEVARNRVAVAESEAKKWEAWVGYLTLTAPFDGVISARNANTGDFVLPRTGDPTAMANAPHLSPSGTAAPIYVVDRTDKVRIFVDVPEADANYVAEGTKASVLIEGFRDKPIEGRVKRTSWALNVKSRTLRAEIDLPNIDSKILPGTYAYATMPIERPDVWVLPLSALAYSGDKTFFWTHDNGRAVRTEVRTGIANEEWVEVLGRRAPGAAQSGRWDPFDGLESVLVGDLSTLAEGEPVRLAKPAGEPTLVASE